jgi:excisionase family DNA binding protein
MCEIDIGARTAPSEQGRVGEGKSPPFRSSAPAHRLAYSVREVAALTGLGRSTIYVLLGEKKLLSLRVGGRRLIPHEALVALLGGE